MNGIKTVHVNNAQKDTPTDGERIIWESIEKAVVSGERIIEKKTENLLTDGERIIQKKEQSKHVDTKRNIQTNLMQEIIGIVHERQELVAAIQVMSGKKCVAIKMDDA